MEILGKNSLIFKLLFIRKKIPLLFVYRAFIFVLHRAYDMSGLALHGA
jgi:hypothetical protein